MKTYTVVFDIQRRSGDGEWTREELEFEADSSQEAVEQWEVEMQESNDYNYYDFVCVRE